MIAICWVFPLLFVLPSLTAVYGIHGLECLSRSCTILKDEDGHSTKNFLFVAGVGVPTLILLITNTSIYVKIKVFIIDTYPGPIGYQEVNYYESIKLSLLILIIFTHNYVFSFNSIFGYPQNMRRSMENDLRNSSIRIPTALKEREQKLTRMLLIIFACFLLSYGPGMLIKVVSTK